MRTNCNRRYIKLLLSCFISNVHIHLSKQRPSLSRYFNIFSTIMNSDLRWPAGNSWTWPNFHQHWWNTCNGCVGYKSKWSSWNQFKMLKMHSRLHHSPHQHALLQPIGTNTPSHLMLSFPLLPDPLPLSQSSHRKAGYALLKTLYCSTTSERLMRLEWLASPNTAVVLLTVDPGVALSAFACHASHSKSWQGKLLQP